MKLECPVCKRANAPHLKRCLYCGAALPAPIGLQTPPPPPELPEDLDALVADALRQGDAGKVRELLERSRAGVASVYVPRPGEPDPGGPGPAAPESSSLDLPHVPDLKPLGAPLGGDLSPRAAPDPIELSPLSPLNAPAASAPAGFPRPPRPSDLEPLSLTDLDIEPLGSGAVTSIPDPTDLPESPLRDPTDLPEILFDAPPSAAAMTGAPAPRGTEPPDRYLHTLAGAPSDPVSRLISEAREMLEGAALAWQRKNTSDCEDRLALALARIQRAQIRVRPAPAPPPDLKLPNFRAAYALVVDGPGDGGMAHDLADALDVDIVTARLQAICRYPRMALQGKERNLLERKASRIRIHTELRASVIPRFELFEVPAPLAFKNAEGAHWRMGTGPLWEEDAESGPDVLLEPPDFFLATPGEIVIRRFRVSARNRRRGRDETDWRALGERRLGVLDLHSPDRFIRIVEGISSFAGLPGYEPSSAPTSFRHFLDALPSLYPGIVIAGRRVCHPRQIQPDPKQGDRPVLSGWSTWEEHTRLCRLHEERKAR